MIASYPGAVFAENGLDRFSPLLPRLSALADLLLAENEKINLTALRTPEAVWLSHFADSLLFADLAQETGSKTAVDVGCGGGFPLLPLALALPDTAFSGLDATRKKLAFVERAAAALGLPNVATLPGRAEELSRREELRDAFDLAVARAVAPLSVLAEYCLPFVRIGGTFLAYKGPEAENELREAKPVLTALGARAEEVVLRRLADPADPGKENVRALVVVRKLHKTPPAYPRRNSEIRSAARRRPSPDGRR